MDALQPLDVDGSAVDSDDPHVGDLMPRLERCRGPKGDPVLAGRSPVPEAIGAVLPFSRR
jgi:hypothetical protein